MQTDFADATVISTQGEILYEDDNAQFSNMWCVVHRVNEESR